MVRHAVIVGGGLAGMAAAAALTDRGWRTTLIDRRPLLGGRATSILDPDGGQLLDNCQHVLLGCCTNLLHLYERLGQRDAIEFFPKILFADRHGRRGALYATALPSPIHLAWSMLRFPLLGFGQKLEIARALAALKRMGRPGRRAARHLSFGAWLAGHGQSPGAIDRFWDVIVTSALNERAHTAGAYHAIQVFQEGFLGHRRGYEMALPRVPLARLYARAVASEQRTGTRVQALAWNGARGRVDGVTLMSGETIAADAVVLATGPDAAARLLADLPPLRPVSAALGHLEQAPIIGAHLFYDRPVLDVPHLALVGTSLQWLFRKDDAGAHVHGVISAAQDLVGLEQGELVRRFDAEIRCLLPAARDARLARSVIVKERRATFRPLPETDAWRPSQRTAVANLVLGGDYTQTGWPGTMEGAVRSGYRAAEVLTGERIERPDLGRV